jgi:hypothetical protein
MAYIKASQGGGGGETGTLIWSNPNSTLTLASGQITFSDNLSNYTKLRIKWYGGGTTVQTRDETKEMELLIPVANIPTGANYSCGLCYVYSSVFNRYFYKNAGDADNTLRTNAGYATCCVPWEIYGIA